MKTSLAGLLFIAFASGSLLRGAGTLGEGLAHLHLELSSLGRSLSRIRNQPADKEAFERMEHDGGRGEEKRKKNVGGRGA